MSENKTNPKMFATLCGRVYRDADPKYFPSAEHRGRTLLFCTGACLGAFLADPDIFCKVHRNSEKTISRVKTEAQSFIGKWRKDDPSEQVNSV
ncbi:MAG: hypothetical protein JNM02_04800 [Anaerolineales bacterium]|nr:hypothetical protein [Anaerolineales bacterium]